MESDIKKQIEELKEAHQESTIEKEKYNMKYISRMYKNWFLDYASYVILERAVPYVYDGLKPVQRRILHAMKRLDDGRYNKVANIIGYTMQYHPHGDASIGDALVQLGQKELLIDTQGNWGNVLTGDSAAAPRYIEARLSKFALEVVFNPKTTEWKLSYDGRNKEPLFLPVKFPLLLAQGVEGIAVGLASKILPHNFNELIDASIKHLKGEEFELYPDFLSGGMIEVSKYNDGLRGGKVRNRAKIEKRDQKTLAITEVPYGKTTGSVIDSILSANDKGKIKIRKIDDNTAEHVEIMVHLPANTSPDKMIDALYAFTDCEISISPNACIIQGKKPAFIPVSEILRLSANNTLELLKLELQIRLHELDEDWHFSSLEKIFIENRIYLKIETCETWEEIIETIDKGLDPFKHLLVRNVMYDDIVRLTEIKIKRISKYDAFKADEHIKNIEEEMKQVKYHLAHIVDYTIDYFKRIKKKYGKGRERRTEIRNFDVIEATKVVVANEKLYANFKEGFVGTGLKKDEYICDCSDIDDIIVFRRDGKYIITKVTEKTFVGKNILHVAVFKRNDERTIYNAVYLDGKSGYAMVKRFAVKAVTRDKEYDLTKGNPHSKILYFTANPNGEAETIKIVHKPKKRLKKVSFEFDFSEQDIKGRNAMGNILTRHGVHKIYMVEKGASTLGDRKIWFDPHVQRLNTDERGKFLGEFNGDDKIVVLTKSGFFSLHTFELTTHFPNDIEIIEKYEPETVYSATFYDAGKKYYYAKRFQIDEGSTINRQYNFVDEDNAKSELCTISNHENPQVELIFGGKHKSRDKEIIDIAEFIGVKGYKARGKRLTTFTIKAIQDITPKETNGENDEDEEDNENDEPTFEVVGRNGKQKKLDW